MIFLGINCNVCQIDQGLRVLGNKQRTIQTPKTPGYPALRPRRASLVSSAS